MIHFTTGEWPPKGYMLVPGTCPTAAASPGKLVSCNCTGACRDTLVRIDRSEREPQDPDVKLTIDVPAAD